MKQALSIVLLKKGDWLDPGVMAESTWMRCVLKKDEPLRLLSSHLDCLVRTWLAHHHEYALLAARCSILFFLPPSAQEFLSRVTQAPLLCIQSSPALHNSTSMSH